MKLTQFTVARQDNGAPLPLASVTVYVTGTTTLAQLYDAAGVAIDNPCQADNSGLVKFKTADGVYDISIVSADGTYSVPPITQFEIYDITNIKGSITSGRLAYSTWAELSGVSATNGQVAEVGPGDTGTHTDPVAGGTVANSGVYRRESAGWRRIYAYGDPAKLDKTGGTMSGILNMGGNRVEGLADPNSDDDAASRGHLRSTLSSWSSINRWKDSLFRALYDAVPTLSSGSNSLDGVVRVLGNSQPLAWDTVSSPLANPSVVCSGTGFDMYAYNSENPVPVGDTFSIRVGIIVPSGTTIQVQSFIRAAYSGTVLVTGTPVSVVGDGTYREISLAAMTNVSGGTAVMVRTTRTAGSGSHTVCGVSMNEGVSAPPLAEDLSSRYTAALAATQAASALASASSLSTQVRNSSSLNLWRDSHFRSIYEAVPSLGTGSYSLDGSVRIVSSAPASWDTSTSPFGNPSVVCTGSTDFVHWLADGVIRSGEDGSLRVGIVVPSGTTVQLQQFFRIGTGGTVVTTGTSVNVVGTGAYQEVTLPFMTNGSGATTAVLRATRTAGSGSWTICAISLQRGQLAHPVSEDRALGYTARRALTLSTSASAIATATATTVSAAFAPRKNLFNIADPNYTTNKFVLSSTGALQTPSPDPAAYSATGFIAAVPGATYTRSASHQMAFYDSTFTYVSGRAALANPLNAETFTVPTGTGIAWMRLSIPASSLATFQVEAGSSATPYEPYQLALVPSYMPTLTGSMFSDGGIPAAKIGTGLTIEQMGFATPSKNLFNIADAGNVLGSFINYLSGSVQVNALYNATHFIPVVPGTQYTVSYSHQRAFYDGNKAYVSGTNSGNSATFTVPAGCYFARFTVLTSAWANFQVETGSVSTAWVAFGSIINSNVLPPTVSTARLDPFLTADGAPIINPYRPEFLRHHRFRLAKLSLPTPEPILMHALYAGDSYTQNASRWCGPYTDKMVSRYGDGGMGFTGFGFLQSGNTAPWTTGNQPTFLCGNARPAKYACRLYGNIVGTYYTDKGPDLAMATLSASGDAVEVDFLAGHPNTVGKLLYVATAGAQVRYTINGGSSWTTVDLSVGTAGVLTSTSISVPSGAGTLRIEWVSGACPLSGVFARGTSGYLGSKIGATGSRASQWSAAPATSFENGIAALEPHAFIYMEGTNSQGSSVAPTTWGDQVQNIIARVRAAVPGIDILIATPPENQRSGNTVAMPLYAIEGRKRALTLRFTFNDMQDVFGDPSNPTEYGSAGAVPLFSSDLIHPDPATGGRSLMTQFLNCTAPYRGA